MPDNQDPTPDLTTSTPFCVIDYYESLREVQAAPGNRGVAPQPAADTRVLAIHAWWRAARV